MKKKHKLKDLELTSVDLCRQGINPDAYIKLIKSDKDAQEKTPKRTPEKASETSDRLRECGYYCAGLMRSIDELIDGDLTDSELSDEIGRSVDEFGRFIKQAAIVWAKGESVENHPKIKALLSKAKPDTDLNHREEREGMAKLTPKEEAEYKRLKAKLESSDEKETDMEKCSDEKEIRKDFPIPKKKSKKDAQTAPETDVETVGDDDTPETDEKKRKKKEQPELPDFAKDILKKSQAFIEKAELKEEVDSAKKYEVLGQRAEDLGKKLLELKRKDEAAYNTVIEMLDNQIEVVNKSGLFAEIGKSGVQGCGASAIEKAEGMAEQIRKSSPSMTYEQAMAQVWDTHPELMAEYNG